MGYYRNQISRIHHRTLKIGSHEPSFGIIPKTYDHAENTLFQWGSPVFPKVTGDKVFL